jgi:hypothetical protein
MFEAPGEVVAHTVATRKLVGRGEAADDRCDPIESKATSAAFGGDCRSGPVGVPPESGCRRGGVSVRAKAHRAEASGSAVRRSTADERRQARSRKREPNRRGIAEEAAVGEREDLSVH